MSFFPTSEGYVEAIPYRTSVTYSYVFQYKDHLGNVRLSYNYVGGGPGELSYLGIKEENNYYPFGLRHNGYNAGTLPSGSTLPYNYKYNSKELQDELGLNMYDYGARNYDPAIGRWMNIDPLAEQGRRWSPYAYAFDNPVYFIDPDGMWPWPTWNQVKSVGSNLGKGVVNYVRNTGTHLKNEATGLVNAYKNIATNPKATLKFAAEHSGPAIIYNAVKSQVTKPANIIKKAVSGDVNGAIQDYGEHLTGGVVALATAGVAKGGTRSTLSSNTGKTTTSSLQSAANEASALVGEGSGAVHGTKVHSQFSKIASEIEGISTEVSYKDGVRVDYGTKGSVRADAVEGNINAPNQIFDLKTGRAKLTPANVAKYNQHVPGSPPVTEIKPQ